MIGCQELAASDVGICFAVRYAEFSLVNASSSGDFQRLESFCLMDMSLNIASSPRERASSRAGAIHCLKHVAESHLPHWTTVGQEMSFTQANMVP